MSNTIASELSKHADESTYAGEAVGEAPSRLWANVVWAALVLLGLVLIVAPIRLGMYQDSAEGAALVRNFTPVLTQQHLDRLDGDLKTVEAARAELQAKGVPADNGTPSKIVVGPEYPQLYEKVESADHNFRWEPNPDYANTVKLIAQFPQTDERFTGWIGVMRADAGTFDQFKSLPSFGFFPFVFGLAGLVLVVVGVLGLLGKGQRALRVVAALVGVGLVLFPVSTGLFAKAPSGVKLLTDFGPILTDENVRWAQDQFVVLGPAAAELQTSYLPAVAQADPQTPLPATTVFLDQWPTISAEFAQVIGAFADNVKHFQALGRLNAVTEPLGFGAFDEFGWFYVAPGLVVLVLVGAEVLLASRKEKA